MLLTSLLDRLLLQLFYQVTHPSWIRTSIDKEMVILSVDIITIDIAIAIPQSVQKAIGCYLTHLFNKSIVTTICQQWKIEMESVSCNLGCLLSFGIAVNCNFVFNGIRNTTSPNTVFVLAVWSLHFVLKLQLVTTIKHLPLRS